MGGLRKLDEHRSWVSTSQGLLRRLTNRLFYHIEVTLRLVRLIPYRPNSPSPHCDVHF